MKIKLVSIVILLFLMIGGMNIHAIDLGEINHMSISVIEDNIEFSQPTNETKGEYLLIRVNEVNMYMREWSKPELPVFRKTYIIPFGAKIVNVECIPNCISQEYIPKKVKPATTAWYIPAINGVPINDSEIEIVEDSDVYSSSNLFPDGWYNYKINCGLDVNKNVIFLTISFFPVRYSPAESTIYYVDNIDVEIAYEESSDPVIFTNEYDMVIISPDRFSKQLQPLIDHKNDHDIKTILKTTEEIYNEYNGRDKPEQIKCFIKDAKETWNISYVLLAGGLKSYIYARDRDNCNHGSTGWHVPVRYTNIEEGMEKGCISDIYYSNLYRYNESCGEVEFEDWDSNGNDIFIEGKLDYLEEVDLCPDVHVGRIPCRNKRDVRIVVNKIIDYESFSHKEESWYKRMISVSGKFAPRACEETPCGEMYCDVSIDYMSNLIEDPVRIYASNRYTDKPVPVAKDIFRELSRGTGFVDIEGHGSPYGWNIYWADAEDGDDWAGGINVYQLWRLLNGKKLPVAIIVGCHTALFNVTLVTSLLSKKLGNDHWYWTSGNPLLGCLCWRFLAKPHGGAIATIGCTAAESMDPNNTYNGIGFSMSCELCYDFYYQIGKENVETLGEAFSGSICKVINENPIRRYEAHLIATQQIFGDPSLKIGGC